MAFSDYPISSPDTSPRRFTDTPLKDSNVEPLKMKSSLPLRGWEKEWAEASPTTYAASRAFVLDMLPFARYVMPSERDAFEQLDDDEKMTAMLWESFGAALWIGGPLAMRATGKGLKKLGQAVSGWKRVPKIEPFEDAALKIGRLGKSYGTKSFQYGEALRKALKNRKLAPGEIDAVADAVRTGDSSKLIDSFIARKTAGKSPSKAFQEITRWEKGRLYPRLRLRHGTAGEFTEEVLRAKHYNRQFERLINREVFGWKQTGKAGQQTSELTTEGVFKTQVERLFGEEAGKRLSFGTVSDEQFANVVLDTLTNKTAIRRLITVGGNRITPSIFLPARVVFGTGEKAMRTLTRVFKPTKRAFEASQRYSFNWVMTWQKVLEELNLGKLVINRKTGAFRFKPHAGITAETFDEAYKIIMKRDEVMEGARRKVLGKAAEEAEGIMAAGRRQVEDLWIGIPKDSDLRYIVDAWDRFSNVLYADFAKHQIPRVFYKAGLTKHGQNLLDRAMRGPNGVEHRLDELLSSNASNDFTTIRNGLKDMLEGIRDNFLDEAAVPFLYRPGADLATRLDELAKQLTYGKGGKWLRYLENYTARMSKNQMGLSAKWRSTLFGEQSAFFTKMRRREAPVGPPVDFGQMVAGRVIAQGKELFLYDRLGEVVNYAKRLPPAWVEKTDEFLSRALGKPAGVDYKLADYFGRTIGRLEDLMGKEGTWNERRVMNLAQTINNLTYMGALGFKPFSILRNLFQPLLTVPAELGGVKDLGTLVMGAKRAMNPATRAYLRRIGTITEYAPEIHLRPKALPFSTLKIGGRRLPSSERLRDVSLWGFRASDRWNRYVTGGAALHKWERALGKVGGQLTRENAPAFLKALKVKTRDPWTRTEIEDLILRGKGDMARDLFVKDVIADTQYLYGTIDAPAATGAFGSVGRTGFIFQTWWMNYLNLIEKWLTRAATGDMESTLTAVLSAGAAYHLMDTVWSESTARRTVAFGPIPKEFNEFMIPPAWRIPYHTLGAILNIQQPDITARHAKALLDSSSIFMVGGLQIQATLKATADEGFKGFAKSIIRYTED